MKNLHLQITDQYKAKEDKSHSLSSFKTSDYAFSSNREIENESKSAHILPEIYKRHSLITRKLSKTILNNSDSPNQERSSIVFELMQKNMLDKMEKFHDPLKKVMNQVQGFKVMWNKKDFLKLLVLEVKMRKFKKGEVLFLCGFKIESFLLKFYSLGDKNTDIFVISNGSVNLFFPKKPKIRPNSTNYNNLENPENNPDFGGISLKDLKNTETHCFFNENGVFCYDLVRKFLKGELVSDESPYSMTNPRICSALCAEDSEIMVIKASDFEATKLEFDKKMQGLVINLLKKSFPMMSNEMLFQLYGETSCENFKKNEKIENEKQDYFCIVKKGCVTVCSEIEMEEIKSQIINTNPKKLEPIAKPLIELKENNFFGTSKIAKEEQIGNYSSKGKCSFIVSSLKAQLILIKMRNLFEIIYGYRQIERDLKENMKSLNLWLTEKLEKHMKSIKFNHDSIQKISHLQGIETEITQAKLLQKQKKKRRIGQKANKIKLSLTKIQQRLSIMGQIFPKIEDPTTGSQLQDSSRNPSETKTLKILSFETKDGVFVRGKLVNSDNMKDIKQKFYPLGYGDLIRINKRKMGGFHLDNISDIKAKDPYKWGREQAMLMNQEKLALMKKFTRKLNLPARTKNDPGEKNMHFQKEKGKNSNWSKLSEESVNSSSVLRGFGPTFQIKKQLLRERKKSDSPLNFLSVKEYLEKSVNEK